MKGSVPLREEFGHAVPSGTGSPGQDWMGPTSVDPWNVRAIRPMDDVTAERNWLFAILMTGHLRTAIR